jgi:hypothetical protein
MGLPSRRPKLPPEGHRSAQCKRHDSRFGKDVTQLCPGSVVTDDVEPDEACNEDEQRHGDRCCAGSNIRRIHDA